MTLEQYLAKIKAYIAEDISDDDIKQIENLYNNNYTIEATFDYLISKKNYTFRKV